MSDRPWQHGRWHRFNGYGLGWWNQEWCIAADDGTLWHATVYWWPDKGGIYRRRATINHEIRPGTWQSSWALIDPDSPANRLLAEIEASKPADWTPVWTPRPTIRYQDRMRQPIGRDRDAEPYPVVDEGGL